MMFIDFFIFFISVSEQFLSREQKQYGVTPLKKAVDLERLKELVTIG
jgi:hypothetical protein